MNLRKHIYTILDTLLVIGAVTCVVTIDGGRWISDVVEFYRPLAISNHEITAAKDPQASEGKSSDYPMPGCLLIPAPAIAEVIHANAVLLTSEYCKPTPGAYINKTGR